MEKDNVVAQKMVKIQAIFREVHESFSADTDLDRYDIEFRSIAYEAASMVVADFKADQSLDRWFNFLHRSGADHATQIHVGLGWALAQGEIGVDPIITHLDPMMRYRALDGYGYYDGIFRRRRSIMSQQKPAFMDPIASGAYDQGLGRSLWYINQGIAAPAIAMLQKFPEERHADLWRGLGIAIAYVGGCTADALREISSAAGSYKSQLNTGAAMALISRHYAGLISADTALTASTLTGRSVEEMIALNEKIRSGIDLNERDAYIKWIRQMESHLA